MTEISIPKNVFPWQGLPWQQLWESKQKQQLAHALLFMGAGGLGKKQFAQVLAKALLCSDASNNGEVCGQCTGCHLINANTHPDLMVIEPAENGKAISVDQIRDV